MNDHGSRRYVEELEALHALLRDYPMASEIAWVQVAVDGAGAAIVEVRLAASRLSEVAAGLIEWERTLGKPTGAVWRSADGENARVVVAGVSDENRTPVLVVGGPVSYRRLVGVPAAAGQKVVFDTDQLYLWAIDLGSVEQGGGAV